MRFISQNDIPVEILNECITIKLLKKRIGMILLGNGVDTRKLRKPVFPYRVEPYSSSILITNLKHCGLTKSYIVAFLQVLKSFSPKLLTLLVNIGFIRAYMATGSGRIIRLTICKDVLYKLLENGVVLES